MTFIKVITLEIFHVASIILLLLYFPTSTGEIAVGSKSGDYKLSFLAKLAALRERQVYFQTWHDKIIAPDVSDPQVKVNKIFRWIADFPNVPQKIKTRNLEQHEYYTLIKQYGCVSEKVRAFCILLTIAGYQAIPFNGENDGRVIVRNPSAKQNGASKWFKYHFKTKKMGDDVQGINLSKKVQEYLESVDTFLKTAWYMAYTRGEKNIPSYRVLCKIQQILGFDVSLIDHVTNQQAVRTSAKC